MRSTPTSATARSAARSTARSRRWSRTLQNGDEVEILTSKAQTAPPAAWESIVVTGKARAAIRRATRVAVRKQYAGLGRRLVERLCQRAKREYSDEQSDRRAAAAGARLARRRVRRRRPRRDEGVRRRPRDVSRLQGGARCRVRRRRRPRPAGSGCARRKASCSGFQGAEHGKAGRQRFRSAASTAICRSASRRTAARCRAIASSAS